MPYTIAAVTLLQYFFLKIVEGIQSKGSSLIVF